MRTTYFDLKPDQTLTIPDEGIEVTLRGLQPDGSAIAEIRSPFHQGTRYLHRRQYVRLAKHAGLFSYGHRHNGRRIHFRLEFDAERLPSFDRHPRADVESHSVP